ncbi:MAG: hypothetical protein PHP23_09485 [Desulfobacterales bacterium]|nr:hypothetical protein [Desulfobacterales bacterium]MDD4071442.1 hypothetical protein [Desulfobacterales bacterium]
MMLRNIEAFPRIVSTEKSNDLDFLYVQAQAKQNLRFPIEAVDIFIWLMLCFRVVKWPKTILF